MIVVGEIISKSDEKIAIVINEVILKFTSEREREKRERKEGRGKKQTQAFQNLPPTHPKKKKLYKIEAESRPPLFCWQSNLRIQVFFFFVCMCFVHMHREREKDKKRLVHLCVKKKAVVSFIFFF